MGNLIETFTTYATSIEKTLAIYLGHLAASLANVSDRHSTAPLTTVCTAHLSVLSTRLTTHLSTLTPTQNALLTLLTIVLSFLLFILTAVTLARLYHGPDPILLRVPPPSATHDPNEDEQADDFADPEVEPQLHSTQTPDTLQCFNPATTSILGFVLTHTYETLHATVHKARLAQKPWSRTTFAQRRAVLRVLHNYILYNQRELCEISAADTGKTLLDASLGEIVPTLEKLRWLIAEGELALRPDRRTTGPMTRHKSASVEYMPLGVIAAIAPWNYPLHNLFNPVVAALFAGNAVVVKPSEHTVYSSLHYARIIRRALALCGHSPELFQLAVGAAPIGQALVEADIDKLFFTGSTSVGRMVAQAAAKRLLPVVLELGGKDAFVVCDDADVAHAASICLRGVFQNAGQNCIGVERVFVHEKIAEQFCEIVALGAKSIRPGVDMGAMTMGEPALHNVQTLVDDAVSKGAELLAGGNSISVNGKGFFYEPTVLKGVTVEMRIAREEVFGPVLSLFEWNSDETLVKMVNACPFGLGSSVFSSDRGRADRILGGLRVGMGNVNDFATNYLCQSMPFGGTKESGSDKFAGIEGLRGCCIAKAVTRDWIAGVKTRLPTVFQYPVGENAFEFAAEINDFMYGQGWLSKLDNVRNMVGMMIFPSWRPRSVGSG